MCLPSGSLATGRATPNGREVASPRPSYSAGGPMPSRSGRRHRHRCAAGPGTSTWWTRHGADQADRLQHQGRPPHHRRARFRNRGLNLSSLIIPWAILQRSTGLRCWDRPDRQCVSVAPSSCIGDHEGLVQVLGEIFIIYSLITHSENIFGGCGERVGHGLLNSTSIA